MQFLSTPSARRATGFDNQSVMNKLFLSTPSARRATQGAWNRRERVLISIHALCEEGDHILNLHYIGGINFYPRPPRGGRLRHSSKLQQNKGYFYPRPPRGGRPVFFLQLTLFQVISIHALREEGDATGCLCVSVSHNFYPRPPRGGRRNLLASLADGILFLSTPSARRATWGRLPR